MTSVPTETPVVSPPIPATTPDRPSAVERLRLWLLCLGLVYLVFSQSAGSTLTDTKIDLVISPLRFLRRSLVLWDPLGAAGQLQNQAYGYLFPMGPFFALGHGVNLPPWEVQRLWESALVIVAFRGMFALTRALGVDRFWPGVVAGLVYALSPRFISELVYISSELMPVAALPWVLLPLVRGSVVGPPKRAALRSGAAFLLAGGVNAAASLAVLPVPALWLLTRSPGPRRRILMRWWAGAILLASLWWLLPLVLLGKYSPPFLNWIESASTTTLSTSLLSTLRGVDHWESLLGPGIWPSGWIFATAPGPVIATAVVAGAGLWGLAVSRARHRLFLFSTLFLGLACVTAGHISDVGPPFPITMQHLLDGALVPFRNVHKFDPLIRLPLAFGVGVLLNRAASHEFAMLGAWRYRLRVNVRIVVPVVVVAAGAVALAPMLNNQVANNGRVTAEPTWWRDTGAWLGEHSGGLRALLVPNSAAPVYLWGPTVDTALQSVAKAPWTVRDAVPLTQAGYIRLLDQIDGMFASGRGSDELAPLLRRAGIGWIVLANDLNTVQSSTTPHIFTRSTLRASSGISLATEFGPDIGTDSPTGQHMLDSGAAQQRKAVQIFRVTGAAPTVSISAVSRAVVANGSNDSLSALIAAGLQPDQPLLFGSDSAALGSAASSDRQVLTEGLRRQEASFGNLDSKSETMTSTQPYSSRRAAYDYLPDGVGPLSTYSYSGISSVTASSSGAQALAFYNRGPGNGPWAALDGDPDTAWYSSAPSGALRQWIEVRFPKPVSFDAIGLSFAAVDGPLPTLVAVETDAGAVFDKTAPLPGNQLLSARPGPTTRLRVTIAAMSDKTFGKTVGISTLAIPGVTPHRTLVVPGTFDPDQIVFAAAPSSRADCVTVAVAPVCDRSFGRNGEETSGFARRFTLSAARTYELGGQVALRAAGVGQFLKSNVRVQATSTLTDDPRQAAEAMIDGNPRTSWTAGVGDAKPTVTVTFPSERTVSSVRIIATRTQPIALPLKVSVTAGSQRWNGELPPDGTVRLPRPTQTRRIVITITQASLRDTTGSFDLRTTLLLAGISELEVNGRPLAQDAAPQTLAGGCPSGIALQLDSTVIPMRIVGGPSAAAAGRPVTVEPCAAQTVTLSAGQHEMSFPRSTMAQPLLFDATAAGAAQPASGATPSVRVTKFASTSRSVQVHAPATSLLVIRENLNPGWVASYHGHHLKAVRIDSWAQGFLVPAGTDGTVTLTYAPQTYFVVSLLIGLIAALVLLLFAWRGVGPEPDADALGSRRVGRPVAAAALALGLFSVATLWGLAVLAVLLVGSAFVRRRWRLAPPVWSGPLVLVVAAIRQMTESEFARLPEANSATTQLLAVAALALTGLACLRPPDDAQ